MNAIDATGGRMGEIIGQRTDIIGDCPRVFPAFSRGSLRFPSCTAPYDHCRPLKKGEWNYAHV